MALFPTPLTPGGGLPGFPGGIPGGPGAFPGGPGGIPGGPGVFPGGPGGPGGPFPGGPGAGQQVPAGPPPSFVPQLPSGVGTFAVDPGGIRRCLFRYTYVWLNNGEQFWFFPIFVGRTSIAGFRWFGRWVYFGIDLNRISSFTCF